MGLPKLQKTKTWSKNGQKTLLDYDESFILVREFQYGDSFFYIIRIWRAILPQILYYDQNKSKADCLGQFFLAFDESALFINFRMRNLSTAKGTKCTKTTKNRQV